METIQMNSDMANFQGLMTTGYSAEKIFVKEMNAYQDDYDYDEDFDWDDEDEDDWDDEIDEVGDYE